MLVAAPTSRPPADKPCSAIRLALQCRAALDAGVRWSAEGHRARVEGGTAHFGPDPSEIEMLFDNGLNAVMLD